MAPTLLVLSHSRPSPTLLRISLDLRSPTVLLGQVALVSTLPLVGFVHPENKSTSLMLAGIALWDSLIAPKGEAGTILVGPSMCKQAAESGWLGPFMEGVSRKPDIMNIHVNKKDAAGIQLDIVSDFQMQDAYLV